MPKKDFEVHRVTKGRFMSFQMFLHLNYLCPKTQVQL